jgi:hypothetical protein
MCLQISQGMPFCECIVKKRLENIEGAIKNEQPRDNGNIVHKTKKNKAKTQHNMYWIPLYQNKHK